MQGHVDEQSAAPDAIAAATGEKSGLRLHALDAVLGVLGASLGWMSFWFPFGGDQGLYHYVGREWLHGHVPYRDVIDHKTPGIYMVHALAVALFGDNMWGVRILEFVAVLLTGLVGASFTAERGERPAPGVRGATILAASLLFYGFNSFWDSSQSEIWYGLLGVSSVWAARRIEREPRAQIAAGFLAGLALVMKPPSIWFVLTAIVVMLARARESGAPSLRPLGLALARFSLGGALALVPILGYFGIVGAWPEMYHIVVRSNARYARMEKGAESYDDVVRRLLDFLFVPSLVTPLLAFGAWLGLGIGVGRRDRFLRDRHLLAIVLVACAFGAVILQMKFYLLHFTVVVAPATVLCANLALDARQLLARSRVGRALGPALFAAVLMLCWTRTPGFPYWRDESRHTARYLRGGMTRAQFADFFQVPALNFYYGRSEEAALWVRDHSNPEDNVVVRGFEPHLYAVMQRRYSGRHFWTMFLTSPRRGDESELAAWNAEDSANLANYPPRYAVTLNNAFLAQDSVQWFLERGYQIRQVIHQYTIMEHPSPRAKP